jgi:hypothetical protein
MKPELALLLVLLSQCHHIRGTRHSLLPCRQLFAVVSLCCRRAGARWTGCCPLCQARRCKNLPSRWQLAAAAAWAGRGWRCCGLEACSMSISRWDGHSCAAAKHTNPSIELNHPLLSIGCPLVQRLAGMPMSSLPNRQCCHAACPFCRCSEPCLKAF